MKTGDDREENFAIGAGRVGWITLLGKHDVISPLSWSNHKSMIIHGISVTEDVRCFR